MTIRSACITSLRSISPPMMQPARSGWSSGITPLHLVVVRTGAPSRSASAHHSGDGAVPEHAQPDQQDRPPGRAEHLERRLQAGAVRAADAIRFGSSGGSAA